MPFLAILSGIAIAALIFCALLWQVYRAVTTTGLLRWNAVGLCLGTLAFMAAVSLRSDALFLLGTALNLLLAPIAIWADPRWSKLLPAVQLAMALTVIYLLFVSSNLPTAAA
ncbi:hypothetical protein [Litoreibacter albidus]|uniref:GGDEF domain-containing protein n=1 Tax=Litoreibacter albidus TaxID=670155 RepID=A0A1H2XU74_9RHOB|nr:hypothetical protein [Litoreibacter albidus]SDW96345.1 hypothetical protein SAMN04488001_2106 [Litoreibacter albidus]